MSALPMRDDRPAKVLRVRIVAGDAAHHDELARIVRASGHEVVAEPGAWDVILADAKTSGFAAAEEPELRTLLTPRELEVLGLIAEGASNKAIARRLDISPHTVKFHVESLFRKLGVRTRSEAVARALERSRAQTVEL